MNCYVARSLCVQHWLWWAGARLPGASGVSRWIRRRGGAHSCEDGRAASRRSCNPAEEPGQTSQEWNLSQGLGEGQRWAGWRERREGGEFVTGRRNRVYQCLGEIYRKRLNRNSNPSVLQPNPFSVFFYFNRFPHTVSNSKTNVALIPAP